MKKCNICDETKEDSEFNKKTYKSGFIGLRSYCKQCDKMERDAWRKANKDWDDARNNAYNKLNFQKIRGHKLRKYWPGSTWEEALAKHESLVKEQNSLCAICKKPGHPTRGLHVDHCHKTDKVRGLLCYNCNSGIGRLQDDTRILLEAVAYITRHKI